ncbi:DUF5013 domain-containing protein [Olivibacter sp. LS-1]|jgi:hypothetical protein|nr:DUF5013 domain-containing protein [Olivibacter sp. LS-1]
MATIRNGKIYQRVVLPPGVYTLEMDIPDCTLGGEFYTIASRGEELPDIANIESALAYGRTSSPGTFNLN